MPSKVLTARSKLGVASRRADPNQIAAARQELAAAKLEAYIAKVVAEAPPLSPEQRDRLSLLFRPAGGVTA
jgi:hypothetical protein